MSELADLERTQRQRWALPGGRHDRLIRFLRVGLPSIIGILLAVLAFSPFTGTQELSFVLNKDEVSLSRERMRLIEALYRGEDSEGRPFSLRAGSAVQKTSAEPVLDMTSLSARILSERRTCVYFSAAGFLQSQPRNHAGEWTTCRNLARL